MWHILYYNASNGSFHGETLETFNQVDNALFHLSSSTPLAMRLEQPVFTQVFCLCPKHGWTLHEVRYGKGDDYEPGCQICEAEHALRMAHLAQEKAYGTKHLPTAVPLYINVLNSCPV